MTEHREELDKCEACSAPIYAGDPHYVTADGCALCAKHSMNLSDVIKQHEDILGQVPFDPGEIPFDTRDEMKANLVRMRAVIAQRGDYNLATGKAPLTQGGHNGV